jgi:DNA-binding transcriptional MerR regulator
MSRFDPAAALPPIPAKRYFTIGEVSELTLVKPHVLRYWEQEFTQLKPLKRRGNRRYYQHHEVLLVRRIRELLYEQGFTISGARNRLDHEGESAARNAPLAPVTVLPVGAARNTAPGQNNGMGASNGSVNGMQRLSVAAGGGAAMSMAAPHNLPAPQAHARPLSLTAVREELQAIRSLLAPE